jgi:CHAT domain-containing protein
VERVLGRNQIHRYQIPLVAAQFVHLDVEQSHLDAMVRVRDPEGAVEASVDNVADREEPLSVSWITPREGVYSVAITLRDPKAAPGRYRLMITAPRAAAHGDGERLRAEDLRARADHFVSEHSEPASQEALGCYEQELALWRKMPDSAEEAATLARMADALGDLGDLHRALDCAEDSLELYRQAGDERGVAAELDRAGLGHSELGEQILALLLLEQSLALRREAGDLYGQGEALNDIAVALGALGREAEAIERYTEALILFRRIGDRLAVATMLKNRAVDHMNLGNIDRALADLQDAMTRFRTLGREREEGLTEYSIGSICLDRGQVSAALRHYQAALTLLRRTGDKRFEGLVLDQVGLAELARGRALEALSDFDQARDILHDCGDLRAEAMVRGNIGRARLAAGDAAAAREELEAALPLVRKSGDRVHEATALVALAQAEKGLGDLDAARTAMEDALSLTESVRGSIPEVGERAAYMAKTRDRYDLLIEILMALEARHPGKGWDAEALRASERARARSLIELLAEARIDIRQGVDPALLEQERQIEARLDERRRGEAERIAAGRTSSDPDADRRAMETLLAQRDDVQARLRASSPRYAALARPQPLTLGEIQLQLLDADTALVEFALGRERSFVWVATPTSLTSRELPPRAAVETAAQRLYEAWSTRSGVAPAESQRRALALSRMVLGPIARHLASRRMIIVSEGTLQYVPWAALPSPWSGSAEQPLAADREIVQLPSATTLAVLRREAAARTAPASVVAVLADPVFDTSDPRVTRRASSPVGAAPGFAANDALTRSMHESGLSRLERLVGSRSEAEAIAAMAGPGHGLLALDFRASRETALGSEVAKARIVHFASHGLVDSRHPELSGIVLSLVDEQGRPQDGFLQTRDIYGMKLSADLVVLSACQSALGKDVRGEGLAGLSRGFMYAGAPRVVASLWPVPDRATAELMKRFYGAMLARGLRPATALREAQLEIRSDPHWSSPYYWAAFVLQGDWK